MKIMNRVQNRTTYYIDVNETRSIFKFQSILNGTSQSWFKSGAKGSIFNTRKANSEFKPHIIESQVKRLKNYKKDEFIDGKCFDETGTEIVFSLFGTISWRNSEFYKYVGENFKSLIVLRTNKS
jgi:protein TonB